MPRHIQVAYGRTVFKLCAIGFNSLTGRNQINYLRDLPLNLADLARNGFPWAKWAFDAECRRLHIEPRSISNL